ncbi:MAG TPA: CHAT domain-containing protein [bacterium]|nr:CHAT domain-containing protein [bacterium]
MPATTSRPRPGRPPPDRTLGTALPCTLALLLAFLPSFADPPESPPPQSEAVAAARRALDETRAEFGDRSLETAHGLLNLARLERSARELEPSRAHYERALAIQEEVLGADHPEVAATLRQLSNVGTYLGDYDVALALGERALAIEERTLGPESLAVAKTLAVLGSLHRVRGEYREAIEAVERSVRIRRAELGRDHPDLSTVLRELAILRFFTGDYEDAAREARHAVEILEADPERDPTALASALDVLAMAAAMVSENPKEASAHWERAIGILEQELGPEHPRLAHPVNNLALHLLRSGKAEEAAPLLERALRLQRKVLGEDHPDLAKYQVNVAMGLLAAGEAWKAAALLESSLVILQEALGPENPDVGRCLDGLARARRRTGDTVLAFEDALRAESITRDHFLETARAMAERDALEYARVRPRGLDVALTLAMEAGAPAAPPARAWDAVIRSRALVLDEIAARRHAVGRLDSLRTRWERATQEYVALEVRGSAGDAERTEAEKRWKAAETGLARAVADRGSDATSAAGFDDVRLALPPHSTLVAYVRFGRAGPAEEWAPPREVEEYLAFVLDPGTESPRAIQLGSATEIDSLVADVRDVTRGDIDEAVFRSTASALRERIWDPLNLAPAERILVVPDGSLGLVSLASLPRAEDDGYLVEGPAIHYLSAERDLVPETAPAGRGLLALGGADHDAAVLLAAPDPERAAPPAVFRGGHPGCPDLARLRFGPLTGALAEVERIGALWRETTESEDALVLTGAGAREATFKRNAPHRRIIHLATHGFFLESGCAADPDARGVVGLAPLAGSSPLSSENPLINSGLALAGANGRDSARPGEEDGILTAEEIASLDLSGVEWAVLSGCDTGRGRVQAGEGLLGLRRAFRIAGARTLIMSLWPVNDEATVSWMTKLYRAHLVEGLSSAEAVRAASLHLLRERRSRSESTHPFTWGAFVAAGDWR